MGKCKAPYLDRRKIETDLRVATNEHSVASHRSMEKGDRPIDAVLQLIVQDMHFSIHCMANLYGIILITLSNSLH